MASRSPTRRRNRHGDGFEGSDEMTGRGNGNGPLQQQQVSSLMQGATTPFLTPPPKLGKQPLGSAAAAAVSASASSYGTAPTAASTPPGSALSSVSSVPSAAPITAPSPQAQSQPPPRRLTSKEFFDTPHNERNGFFAPDLSAGAGRASEADLLHRNHDDGPELQDPEQHSPIAMHHRSRVLFHEKEEDDVDDDRDATPDQYIAASVSRHRTRSEGAGSSSRRVSPVAADAAALPSPLAPQDPPYLPSRRSVSGRSVSASSHRMPTPTSHIRRSPSDGGSPNRRRSSRQQRQPQYPPPYYDDYAHSSAPDMTVVGPVGTTRLRGSHNKSERRRAQQQQQGQGQCIGNGHRSSPSFPPYHNVRGGALNKSSKLLSSAKTVDDTTPLTSMSSEERTSSSTESSPERQYHQDNRTHHSASWVPEYADQYHHDHHQSSHSLPSPSKDKFSRQQQFFWSQRYNGGGGSAVGPLPLTASSGHTNGVVSPSASNTSRTPSSSSFAPASKAGDSPLSSSSPPLSPRNWAYISASKVKIRFRTLLSWGLTLIRLLLGLLVIVTFKSYQSDMKAPPVGGYKRSIAAEFLPTKTPRIPSKARHHPSKNVGYPRVLAITALGRKESNVRPRDRKIELYPAEFSDNTQFYPVADSTDDERLDRMEMRLPYDDGECAPMHDWQTTSYPVCNGMHELDVEHGHDVGDGEDMQLFGTKGFWRHAWRVDLPGEKRTLKERDTFVLKTLKLDHNFEDKFEEHDRIDAIAMERLTSSPHVINIYGYCGHSVLTEYADGPRLGTLADKSKKVPMKRLEIARDIAVGLADVHGIDGDEQASFVHLDINPANVVVVGKTLKLNDFNIGIILKKNKKTGKQCGFPAQYPNPQWRSPEEANESDNLTEKVDVFSMGHIFYRLICGHEPWNKLEPGGRPSKEETAEKVKQGKLPFVPEDIMKTKDPELQAVRDAMLKCYTADPTKRPSARTIATFLDKKLQSLSQSTKVEIKKGPNKSLSQSTKEEIKRGPNEKAKDPEKEKQKGEVKTLAPTAKQRKVEEVKPIEEHKRRVAEEKKAPALTRAVVPAPTKQKEKRGTKEVKAKNQSLLHRMKVG